MHFVILTLSRQPGFAHQPAMDPFLAFKWPSVVWALDILGWDVFFALSMLFAAQVFHGAGLCHAIRIAMITSAVLALAGLGGVVLGEMQLRNTGIAGNLGAFLVVDALLLAFFLRANAASSTGKVVDAESQRNTQTSDVDRDASVARQRLPC